ncbi:inositol monophosphatase family protein [Telmatocola sphagniphila]|nr:inositol monophosphatase family protein [Telmatocola sphagniphila]
MFRLTAEEAARAGAEQLESWRGKFNAREKGRADMVTEADLAAQQAVKTVLLTHFPDHGFLGEEDGRKTGLRPASGSAPLWVVDPLDGTSNYVHDVPAYCVSIGLWADDDLQIGVIYDPRLNEMFSTAKGHGATLNRKPIRVSQIENLRGAMLSTGFPPAPDAQLRNLEAWRPLSLASQAMRRTGSTALNLAYVACGRFDGYWAFDNYPWDVVAGLLLVREAGGMISRLNGDPFDPFEPDVLATNGKIHPEMLGYLVK